MDELIYLVMASRTGDAEAFRQLVRRFQDMAYGYACAILGDVHLAEDATQEAFIEAYERMPSLIHPLAFPGWLRQLVLKHCDRQTRGKRLIATVHTLPEPASLEWDSAQIAERRDLAQHVLRAIQTLPEHQREITTLFYLKGCSQQDIAAFLDVPLSTITTRLQRARQNLKQRMFAVAEEALRQNYLDDRFATHLVASLMGRPKLLTIDGHPIRGHSADNWYRLVKFVNRHRLAVANVVLALLVLTAFAVYSSRQARDNAAQRDEATRQRTIAQNERDNAQTVTDLLVDAFVVADPFAARSSDQTVSMILERGAEIAEKELRGQPEIKSTLMLTLGRIYQNLGRYEEAEAMVLPALEMRRASLGAQHRKVGETLVQLASLRLKQGKLVEAGAVARESLAVHRTAGNLLAEADTMRLLADIELSSNHFEEATQLAQRALAIHRDFYDSDHPQVAESLLELAKVQHTTGETTAAEATAAEALAMSRRIRTDDDLNMTRFLNLNAVIAWRGGHTDEAESLLRQVVALRRENLDPRHPSIAEPLNNLANILAGKGEHREAEPLLREAVAILEEAVGPDHPNLAQTIKNLGTAVEAQGRFGEAEGYYRRAIDIEERVLGEDHWAFLQSLDHLTRVQIEQEKFAAAYALQERALAIRRESHAETSQHVIVSRLWLAFCQHKQGNLAAAETMLQDMIAVARTSEDVGSWLLARMQAELAEIYAAAGRLNQALPLAKESAAQLEQAFPEGHFAEWRVADAKSILGWILFLSGETEQAEPMLEHSLDVLKRVKGPDALITREAAKRLAQFKDSLD